MPLSPQTLELMKLVASGEITPDQAREKIAKAEQVSDDGVAWKISPRGGLSVYGLQRWPVTLYMSQWRKLLAHADEILAFLDQNEELLRPQSDKAPPFFRDPELENRSERHRNEVRAARKAKQQAEEPQP